MNDYETATLSGSRLIVGRVVHFVAVRCIALTARRKISEVLGQYSSTAVRSILM